MNTIRAGVNPPHLSEADPGRPQGILVGLGSLVVIVVAFVASAVPPADAVLRYAVLVLAVFGFAAATSVWRAPIVTAVIGFLVFGGFLVNHLGQLTWHGSSDGIRLVALGAAVIFGRLAGDVFRMPRSTQARRPAASTSVRHR
ncbi:MFS family permease [Hamadaea flava]|uniref:Uncharacterized protein n=1 Tax=Hamadaea flava TaxID=1742688 RepID=A0ABV8M2E6_9ACTN|nr:hypothetical protein [Hamadaea flava]MCP2328431.1 MFS family permease [Hamadaea flava]